jgi:hypothetical protein
MQSALFLTCAQVCNFSTKIQMHKQGKPGRDGKVICNGVIVGKSSNVILGEKDFS